MAEINVDKSLIEQAKDKVLAEIVSGQANAVDYSHLAQAYSTLWYSQQPPFVPTGAQMANLKYDVAIGSSVNKLIKEVQLLLDAGWQPNGGISIAEYSDNDNGFNATYAQGMVMEQAQARAIEGSKQAGPNPFA